MRTSGSMLRRVLVLGIALIVAGHFGVGCATVRRAREVQKGDHVPAGERTLMAAEVGLGSNSTLTLEEAVCIALAYHPTIAVATQNLAAAVAQVSEARSGYAPTVSGSAGYSRATSNVQGAPASHDSQASYQGALNLDMVLYDFGRTPASVRQAVARQTAAASKLQAARNDVTLVVRTAFYGLWKAQELLQVAEEAVRQYAAHLDQARAFVEVGTRIRYDVTKAEVDLGNAQLQFINASNDLVTARVTLNRSLGLAEEPGYRIAPVAFEEFHGRADALMAVARERHPELTALKANQRLASAAVDAAIADLYPSLGLQGRYGAGGDSFPLIWNWSGAVQSTLDLFTATRKTGRIDEAVAQLRSARAQLADREQQIYMDLTQALGQLDSARQRMDLTALTLRQARESLDLINERYRVGKASAVEVTDAQVALTGARADQVKARFEYLAAVAQIKHAVGEQ